MKAKLFSPFILALLFAALSGTFRDLSIISRIDEKQIYRETEDSVANISASVVRSQAIIVDHTSTDIGAIPQSWIEQAIQTLHIEYGHTSHGSQLTTGMSGLVTFANKGGLGLSLPDNIFRFNYGGVGGELDLREGDLAGDVGYYPQWVNETVNYLGAPDPGGRGTDHPEINVVIWSWCGQASGLSEQQMLDQYLLPMAQLENDYPGITFVYMTGHSDGTGDTGNLHLRNQQIRDYVTTNNKVLYDFYDIELYDPDANYFGDKLVNDNCDYDSDANGTRDRNWAIDWQNTHTQDVDWYSCSCAHSQSLNCNQKAYAAWWLWARLVGWDGGETSVPMVQLSWRPASQTIFVNWTIADGLPDPESWQLSYTGPVGDEPSPITNIPGDVRRYTLTGLSNYTWYDISLSGMVNGAPIMTDTVKAMPTDILIYLPALLK